MKIYNITGIGSSLTGSFSGSFIGDGSNITSISSDNISFNFTAISSSAQIADDISGSLGPNADLIRGLTASSISGSNTALSSSIATRFISTEANISSLNAALSSYLLNTTDTLTGDLTVTGKVTAQEFHTEYVSSSIVFQSGSTKFGDTSDDVHQFTGSLTVTENVGIGTSSPNTMLEILYPSYIGKDTSQGLLRLVGQSNNENAGDQLSAGTAIEFYNKWSGGDAYSVARIAGRGSQSYDGGLQFDVAQNTAPGQSNFVNAITILKTANVGIGTTSPSDKLHVNGGSIVVSGTTYPSITFSPISGTNFGITNRYTDNRLSIDAIGTGEIVNFLSNGKVGIGTTTLGDYTLSINRNSSGVAVMGIKNSSATGYSGAHIFNDTGTVVGHWGYGNASISGGLSDQVYFGSTASKPVVFTMGDVEKMRIHTNSNVGIGTTNPSGKFDIAHDMYTGAGVGVLQAGAYGNINFKTGSSTGAFTNQQGITWQVDNYGGTTNYGVQAQIAVGNNGNVGTFMGFFTSNNYGAPPVERIRIQHTGNVGIGTTNPTANLYINANSANLTQNILTVQGGGSSGNYGFSVLANNGDTILATDGLTYNVYAAPTSGKVGIGTTSPVAKLSVFADGTSPHPSPTGISVSAGAGGANIIARDSSTHHNWFPYADGNNYYSADGHIFRNNAHTNDWVVINSSGITVKDGGSIVNQTAYRANTFIQLTSIATKTFTTTGQSQGSFAVTDFTGVPSNAKAIQVHGWYHITGYGVGSGQGDHAVSWFGLANGISPYSWSGPGNPWPGDNSTFYPAYYGSFAMEHDGDSSVGSANLHYYGSWHNGIINVNANGSIYYTLAHGYSGGTHYNALYCTGYWI